MGHWWMRINRCEKIYFHSLSFTLTLLFFFFFSLLLTFETFSVHSFFFHCLNPIDTNTNTYLFVWYEFLVILLSSARYQWVEFPSIIWLWIAFDIEKWEEYEKKGKKRRWCCDSFYSPLILKGIYNIKHCIRRIQRRRKKK